MVDVVVTGATGAIGGAVAQQLARDGVAQRLVVRGDASRAPALPGSQVAVASYDQPDALRAAFDGARVALFVSGAEHPDRLGQHRTVAAALADAGVERVVYTSFLGAASDATFTLGRDHFHTEQALRDAGLTVTALRDAFYQDVLPYFFDEEGVVRGPAGDGAFTPVARRDVAEVATAALRDERWAGEALLLTGPDRVTMAELAELLAATSGEARRYHEETVEEAYASRRAAYPDAQQFELDAWVSTYTAIADGSQDVRSDDVGRVLGRPPTPLAVTLAG